MGRWDAAGDAVRQVIAGYLPYNPGPGIYSRLERAVEAMPENVRVQELPGLIKRYKDGVPVWELKETDLDSVVAGRDVVPRSELLARVKERSPVYTHGEVVLGGRPQIQHVPTGGTAYRYDADTDTLVRLPDDTRPEPDYQFPDTGEVSRLGEGVSHGETLYSGYGQGGKDYTELLLTQPGQSGLGFDSHWAGTGKAQDAAVAHARYDTHGDALRINELQSDLGIHNRKAREGSSPPRQQLPSESDSDYADAMLEEGYAVDWDEGGDVVVSPKTGLPFPLEDAWSDMLIKRLALEAARGGHRAIEVASPASVFAKTGNRGDPAASLERMEHFYGKVVPGAVERLGRKMGGLVEDVPALRRAETKNVWDESEDLLNQYRRFNQGDPERIDAFNDLLDATSPATQRDAASKIYAMFDDGDPGYATAATRDALALAEQTNAARAVRERLLRQGIGPPRQPTNAPGRRYVMSDEMRRRIIEGGIGASLLAPLASQQGGSDGQVR